MFAYILYPEREKSLQRRHPWIFSKAVAQRIELPCHPSQQESFNLKELTKGLNPKDKIHGINGELAAVLDSEGKFLCYAHYSQKSQIRLRAFSFDINATVDYNLVKQRLSNAIDKRQALKVRGDRGMRLVAAEGDMMPGLIVDRYNDILSFAITSWGMEQMYEWIVKALHELCPACYLYERSDSASRLKEDLPMRAGFVDFEKPSRDVNLLDAKGNKDPKSQQITKVKRLNRTEGQSEYIDIDEAIPEPIYVKERDLIEIPINVRSGHKTGGYLDQRQSRYHTYELCKSLKALSIDGKKGPSVLNCFSYTGGFGLAALKGGASAVYNVDVSDLALKAAKAGVAFNHLDPGRCKFIREDVFEYLRKEVAKGTKFDVVILDPPKFVESQATLKRGCRGYQDINRLGMQLVRPGGHLLTFSCSGLMPLDLFQKIVADAALDAKVDAQVLATLRQDIDHIVAMSCPDSFYLKGLDIIVN